MTTLLDKWSLLVRMLPDSRLKQGAEVRVAIVLLDHFNAATGRCDPSVETIAKRAGLSRRPVLRALSKLVHCGYFSSERRGWHRSNAYTPNFEAEEVSQTAPLPTQEVLQTSPQNAAEVLQTAPREVSQTAPKTGKEKPVREDEHGKGTSAAPSVALFPVGQSLASGSRSKSGPSKRRGPPKRCRQNNLLLLEAFAPAEQQLVRLRKKAPRVAPELTILAEQFRTDPYWRKQFAAGAYSDPAACFENFIVREERFAARRSGARASGDGASGDFAEETDRLYQQLGVLR